MASVDDEPMIVWVLESGHDYEGRVAVGVYASLELAKDAISAAKRLVKDGRYRPFGSTDSWHVTAFRLDAKATEAYPDSDWETLSDIEDD